MNPTRKQNHTTARGGILIPSHTAPLMTTPIHTIAVDPTEARRSMATILVTGHPPQETAIHLIGGRARHHTAVALSGVTKDQVFCIRSSGVDTLVVISAPEEGPGSSRVMA